MIVEVWQNTYCDCLNNHRPDKAVPQPLTEGRGREHPELPVGWKRGRNTGRYGNSIPLLFPGRTGKPGPSDG